jgi:hypothetical protein
MSFTGTGLEDLELILNAFPRTFTVEDVVNQFGWTKGRARQAIVNGQQNDSLRTNTERVTNHGISQLAIYENNRWRAEWIKRAWGPHHERNMDREGQQHS